MQLIPKKHTLLFLAAAAAILLGIMSLQLTRRNNQPINTLTYEEEIAKIETQSENSDLNSIEKDLTDTDLNNLDKELENINQELNSVDQ